MKKLNLFNLAWPIFIETAMFILLGIIDVYILSSYDDLAASSVNTANQTISIVTIVFQILSTAGAGDVYFPAICAVLSNWVISVGCSYLLAVVCGIGIYGLWIALAADECVRGIMMIIRWKSGAWRAKRVVEESDGEESTTNQFVLANEKGAVALSPQKEKDRVA